MDALAVIREYHKRTKHSFKGYAESPGFLDWESQPNVFRHFEGSPLFRFPRPMAAPAVAYDALFTPSANSSAVTIKSLGGLFEYSLGLSAWKTTGFDSWSLRVNPSSGNLHPTEAYCVLFTNVEADLPAGIYHYSPYWHGLEQLAVFEPGLVEQLQHYSKSPFGAVVFTSVQWREEWKYGARGFRYCQHDVGHAFACLSFSAKMFGWHTQIDTGVSDEVLSNLLNLASFQPNTDEPESCDLLVYLSNDNQSRDNPLANVTSLVGDPPAHQTDALDWSLIRQHTHFVGAQSNTLSNEHVAWPLATQAHAITRKPAITDIAVCGSHGESQSWQTQAEINHESPPAGQIIRNRRSAQRMHKGGAIKLYEFERALHRCLPSSQFPLWQGFGFAPTVNFIIFVHGVEGLAPGLYCLIRDQSTITEFKQAVNQKEFLWQKVINTDLALYALTLGDISKPASKLSCYQGIAGHGAFCISMIANMTVLSREGAWAYRRLFWEAGALGQLFYLEAEASGLSGTGIGCFFDDDLHRLVGLEPEGPWQVIYHFTVGKALIDHRLTSLSAYQHLEQQPAEAK